MDINEMRAEVERRQMTCSRIKKMIVSRLDLTMDPEWITDDQSLFGRGLELDSLDFLELAVGVEVEFGVALYESQISVFGSVSTLANAVEPGLRRSRWQPDLQPQT
ncbi:acyl carrier protein [Nonomuraea sp. K274]|uniref:Acyl carrier protein n=1 Tax=Nonomuraea cypriaca TaxID=1187855 RepID=A0A931A934_9ACTN|nr:phosphopantetheine-binding protein [Nonomuraea cypriaca]MBF8186909.1 acyl carrier protein [Nonomuraea cypriaca]